MDKAERTQAWIHGPIMQGGFAATTGALLIMLAVGCWWVGNCMIDVIKANTATNTELIATIREMSKSQVDGREEIRRLVADVREEIRRR